MLSSWINDWIVSTISQIGGTMSKTKVIKCSCKHKFQDNEYGKGNRLHNYARKGYLKGDPGWRCTVCSNVKPAKDMTD